MTVTVAVLMVYSESFTVTVTGPVLSGAVNRALSEAIWLMLPALAEKLYDGFPPMAVNTAVRLSMSSI
jgi:hypothetical protein